MKNLLPAASAAVMALACTVANASPWPLSTAPAFRLANDRQACSQRPDEFWCAPQSPKAVATDWTARDLYALDLKVRASFHFQLNYRNAWNTRLSAVNARTPWRGDCDTLALTTLAALIEAGFPPASLWRAIVDDDNPKTVALKHMVAIAYVEDEYWVVGDSDSRPQRLKDAGLRPHFISRADEGSLWRRTAPTGLKRTPAPTIIAGKF